VLEFDHHLVTHVVLAPMLADIEAWWPGGIVLGDIDARRIASPLAFADVERATSDLPIAAPLDRRVSACIVGAPDPRA